MKRNILIGFIAITLPLFVEASGSSVRGGGDPCENRIKTIRDDISSWIDRGGAKSLELPKNLKLRTYTQRMRQQLTKAKIQCVGEDDKGYPVQINGMAKTCIFNRGPTENSIVCDQEKFLYTEESEQYVLIHHEYAGLAGLEVPNGSDSDYKISNQLSDYLEDHVVKKLAVKEQKLPAKKLLPDIIPLTLPHEAGEIQVELHDITKVSIQPFPSDIYSALKDFQRYVMPGRGIARLYFVTNPSTPEKYIHFPWKELHKKFRAYHEAYKGCGSFTSDPEKMFVWFFRGTKNEDWPQISNFLGRFLNTYTYFGLYQTGGDNEYHCQKVGGFDEDQAPWYSVSDTVLFQSLTDVVPKEIKTQYDSAILVIE